MIDSILKQLIVSDPTLTELSFNPRTLEAKDTIPLFEALAQNQTLEQLKLSGVQLGRTEAVLLLKFLQHHPALTHLELAFTTFKETAVKYLAAALQDNENLTDLTLCASPLGAEGMRLLSKGLRRNAVLESLDVSDTKLGHEGALHLARVLIKNETLTSIIAAGNELGDMGADYMAQGLRGNHALTSLDLSYNNIGSVGVAHLSKALEQNTSLRTLSLALNPLDEIAVGHLSHSLQQNKTLTCLELRGTELDARSLNHLIAALEKNTTLTELWFNTVPENPEVTRLTSVINGYLTRNQKIAHMTQALQNLFEGLTQEGVLADIASKKPNPTGIQSLLQLIATVNQNIAGIKALQPEATQLAELQSQWADTLAKIENHESLFLDFYKQFKNYILKADGLTHCDTIKSVLKDDDIPPAEGCAMIQQIAARKVAGFERQSSSFFKEAIPPAVKAFYKKLAKLPSTKTMAHPEICDGLVDIMRHIKTHHKPEPKIKGNAPP